MTTHPPLVDKIIKYNIVIYLIVVDIWLTTPPPLPVYVVIEWPLMVKCFSFLRLCEKKHNLLVITFITFFYSLFKKMYFFSMLQGFDLDRCAIYKWHPYFWCTCGPNIGCANAHPCALGSAAPVMGHSQTMYFLNIHPLHVDKHG